MGDIALDLCRLCAYCGVENMSNLTSALVIVMMVNVVLFLGQMAVNEISSDGPQFTQCEGSLLGAFDVNNCATSNYSLDDSDPADKLPTGESSVAPDTGNIFTDIFTSARSWVLDSLGLKYVVGILSAPSNFLKALGVPPAFAFAIGALWYGVTLFLLISWIMGRDA